MPELPEVESIRLSLCEHVIGKKIDTFEVRLPRIVRRGDLKAVVGKEVKGIQRHGKYLWLTFKESEIRLYFHMGMSGTLLWKEHNDEEPSHVRIVIGFRTGRILFRDPRTFGGLWIDEETCPPWNRLGIDLLDTRLTPEAMEDLFANRRIQIKTALLDQQMIAGIGNIYASEALFRACINPFRRACDLNPGEFNALHASLVEIVRSAIDNRGTTFRDFKLSDGKDGSYQNFLKVYNKEGKPCVNCGRPIVKTRQAQRSTFYCPDCQT